MDKITTKKMSRKAFSLLTGIPDIWLRMQTLRITEFFLLINSKNCISGRTTQARLCALYHKPPRKMTEVLQNLFHKETTINHRQKNRLGDTIKWMKGLSLEIRENAEDKSDILKQIQNLTQILQNKTIPNQHIIAHRWINKPRERNPKT